VQARKKRSDEWEVLRAAEEAHRLFQQSFPDISISELKVPMKNAESASASELLKALDPHGSMSGLTDSMSDLKLKLAGGGDARESRLSASASRLLNLLRLRALQEATPNASHQLLSEAEAQAALAASEAAAAAAEAAQRQLMLNSSSSSSAIAQVLAADPKLYRIAEAYTELQWLHHMAVQQKLQQYGSTAASLPGFAYACLAEAAGKGNNKKPGGSISLYELVSLSKHSADALQSKMHTFMFGEPPALTQDKGISSPSSPLQLLAEDLLLLLNDSAVAAAGLGVAKQQQQQQQLLSDLRLLVLPDLSTLLMQSLNSASTSGSSSSAAGVTQQLVAALLQQGCQPPAAGSMPLLIEQQLDDFVAALAGKR
jgi:hypothetical protein